MNTVTSKDGTQIGYAQIGHGPGLILVQGALGTAHNYRDLAQALSSDFTVYTPDRRGRVMSPRPFTPNHQIQRDVEDIEALSTHTGATRIICGNSSRSLASRTPGASELYRRPAFVRIGILLSPGRSRVGTGRVARRLLKQWWLRLETDVTG